MADTPPNSAAEEMNVKIKTMLPATYELKIPAQASVGDLKQRLVELANIPQERQRIIYKGRVLDNDQQLQAHGVQEGHTLHLVERAPDAPAPAASQAPNQAGQRDVPVALGSLELDTDETDVNALLSSIFNLLGGQGHAAGFVAGEGSSASDEERQQGARQEAQFIAQQLVDSLGGQAGQDPNMQAFGGMPGERRPNMLASIQTYLQKLQEIMENPSVLLPSLSYPPGQEHELREQRQLMDAVRGILTPAVRQGLGAEQQAFLSAEASWHVPAPAPASSGRQASASQTNSAQATSRSSATGTATAAPTAAVPASSTAAAGADTSHHAAGVTAGAPDAPAAAAISHGAAAIDPAAADSSAVPAASSAPQGSSEQAQPQSGAGQSQGTIGAARESASGSRGADGSRRRRGRRPAISPVVTMALGSLLQTTLEGEAFQDPVNVLGNAAQLLATAHTFDGQNRAQILEHLRSAGSHLYRLAPLLMELARACSAAVAAMQGDAGPLALSSSHYIRPDGTRPAIGYTPASMQQIVTSMSIPMFPGMPMGAMHLGPNGAQPTMAGPAPAANGPAAAPAGSRGGAGNASGAAGAAAAAGAGANRPGQPMGINLGTLLQSAFGGAGGQPHRPGVSVGESRQVIQVPGAPPISIRFGSRSAGSQTPAIGQQGAANTPVSFQVGNGTPVDLAPIIQSLGTMLGSAIQSAVSSATPAAPSATPAAAAGAPAATAAGASAGRATAGGPAAPGAAAASSLLNPPAMQAVVRALMHSISPFVNTQATQQAAPGAGPTLDPATLPSATASGANRGALPASVPGTAAAAAAPASGQGQTRAQLGLSDPLDAMIGGMNPAQMADGNMFVGHMDAQGLVEALTQAGATSVNVQGPFGAEEANPASSHATDGVGIAPAASASSAPAAATAEQSPTTTPADSAAGPSSSTTPSLPGAASASPAAAGTASGMTRPAGQRAVGLGSAALPPRDKASKKSHPRSPVPDATSGSTDQPSSSRQSPGSRPAPSQPQQDNVKRARRGGSPPDTQLPSQSTTAGLQAATAGDGHSAAVPQASTAVQPGATAARGEGVEEIAQPNLGIVPAGSAGGLDAIMSSMFGGGGGSGGGGGGMNMNSLMQAATQMMADPEVSRGVTGMIESLGQRAGAGGRVGQSGQGSQSQGGSEAGGGLGAMLQSLGPMMQQLAVGASGQAQSTGAQQRTGSGAGDSINDWQAVLSGLDVEEKAEWERTIREDLEKQADFAPEKYQDHSTAYLAGKPPSATSMLLPSDAASANDEDSD